MQVRFAALLVVLVAGSVSSYSWSDAATAGEIPRGQSVYIEFERFDRHTSTIWLRLWNNTAWAIRIPVESSDPGAIRSARSHENGAEARVRYYLDEYDPRPQLQITGRFGKKVPPDEPTHPPVPKINRVDFLTEWWIPRGESIVFEVPKQHLARNVRLYVYLRYEWEDEPTEVLNGPVHLVYFRGT